MPNILERLRGFFTPRRYYWNWSTPEEFPSVEGMTARELYASQANLHAVVSFLSDSVAQLPLKVYRRVGENNRQRDRESGAALLLYRPNADQTEYEFINSFAVEFLLHGCSFVWLLPDGESPSGYQLRLIPCEWIRETESATNYAPDVLHVSSGTHGEVIEIPRTQFIPFRMYSPGAPGGWQGPIPALKQTLSEQIQADRFRTQIWRSSGRFNAYLTRPKDVAAWSDTQRQSFIETFRAGWSADGEHAGGIPLLEDGMELKPYQFSSKEAQYAEARQLSREDVAAAYHVNPSLIWHTTTQTYASAKDNARSLYADCLGPLLQMTQQRINSFLLPLIGADPDTYVEFDLAEKLKGSFEERAALLQAAVGVPWMTRDEARADNNLPPLPDGQGTEVVTPLNVAVGRQIYSAGPGLLSGPTAAKSADVVSKSDTAPETGELRIPVKAADDEREELSDVLRSYFARQRRSLLPRIGAGDADWMDFERWDKELADDLEPRLDSISDAHGKAVAEKLGTRYDPEITRAYLRKMAEGRAHATNAKTQEAVQAALDAEDDEDAATPADVFDRRENDESDMLGRTLATAVAGWATGESCRQAEDQGYSRTIEKRWVTGPNPRGSHALMNGQRVPIDQPFSNGAYWPGDDNLSADESCGCNCTTEIIIS